MDQIWRLGSKTLDCSQPRVMAIVNATPDSFFSGSRINASSLAEDLAKLVESQPDCIDIGGQSSRPGSLRVNAHEELQRVLPVIASLRTIAPEIPITVDTYSAEVAREVLAAGADGINDISAGSMESGLIDVVAGCECGYVLMHMQGSPETMQQAPHYDDCVGEISDFLGMQLQRLELLGVVRERIVIDPGVGFGKRVEDNIQLIQRASEFSRFNRPLLYGISRKSFIGKLSGTEDPAWRLPGTLGITWELLSQGVMLHRVHDAGEVKQLCAIWQALRGSSRQ